MNRKNKFQSAVSNFPAKAEEILFKVPDQGGALKQDQVDSLLLETGWSKEELMIRLLALAKCFAHAPVSGFEVGAVAQVQECRDCDYVFFMGSNLEFINQPLNQTVHAEQAALINALHRESQEIKALAVTDPPCGHCRQFLAEYGFGAGAVRIITQDKAAGSHESIRFSELLPKAFGPWDLENPKGLASAEIRDQVAGLEISSSDPLVLEALNAAGKSYAPYSDNLAGCALETTSGLIVTGRYVENAAFNPSLSPLHSAIIRLNLSGLEKENRVQRAVLVEKRTLVQQKQIVESLLETWAPQVCLEYVNLDE